MGFNSTHHEGAGMATQSPASQARDPQPPRAREPAGPTVILPRPLTSFVGRERDIAAVLDLVATPDVRLVTLTGPGGAGKTRLGLMLAHRLRDAFTDGVAFVPLGSILDPSLAPAVVAQAIGVPDATGQSLPERTHAFVATRTLLLLLDNLEHLPGTAALVADLLAHSLHLKIVCTSRVRLGVSGEHVFPVPSLSAGAARDLFEQRAHAIDPEFSLAEALVPVVDEICGHLDGLPLAIELAAARVDVLPPAALLERIEHRLAFLTGGPRDAPTRQQTMRNTIAWSHDLLGPRDQMLLRRLAVFGGGFTLEAAGAVMDDDGDVLEGVSTLLTNNLIKRARGPGDEPRFQMLETIREFALETLDEHGETEKTRIAHARYLMNLTETAIPHYDGPDIRVFTERVEAEIDNCRDALAWCLDYGEAETAVRLAGALWRIWWPSLAEGSHAWTERVNEGLWWIERTLEHRDGLPISSLVEALSGASFLSILLGHYERSHAFLDELLARSESESYLYGMFFAHMHMGSVDTHANEYESAKHSLERALVIAPLIRNSENQEALALALMAELMRRTGEEDASVRLFDESLERSRLCGNPFVISATAFLAGQLQLRRSGFPRAAALLTESVGASVALNNLASVRSGLTELARVALAVDRPETAAQLLFAGQDLFVNAPDQEAFDTSLAQGGSPLGVDTLHQVVAFDATLRETRSRLGEDSFHQLSEAFSPLSWDDLLAMGHELATAPLPGAPPGPRAFQNLTPREVEVLRLVAEGRSNRNIAGTLSLSERTVENHVGHILTKLNLDSRVAAATHAVRHDLV